MTAISDTELSFWRAPTLLSLPLERPYGYPIKFSKLSFTVTPVVISKAVLIHNNSISFDKKRKKKIRTGAQFRVCLPINCFGQFSFSFLHVWTLKEKRITGRGKLKLSKIKPYRRRFSHSPYC